MTARTEKFFSRLSYITMGVMVVLGLFFLAEGASANPKIFPAECLLWFAGAVIFLFLGIGLDPARNQDAPQKHFCVALDNPDFWRKVPVPQEEKEED